eukprot:scaffold24451_cov62-Phaeocystis_antarctica.AAC.4
MPPFVPEQPARPKRKRPGDDTSRGSKLARKGERGGIGRAAKYRAGRALPPAPPDGIGRAVKYRASRALPPASTGGIRRAAKYRAGRTLPPGLYSACVVLQDSNHPASRLLVAFARLVSRAQTNGDVYSLHALAHARGANSTARSRPHAAVAPR